MYHATRCRALLIWERRLLTGALLLLLEAGGIARLFCFLRDSRYNRDARYPLSLVSGSVFGCFTGETELTARGTLSAQNSSHIGEGLSTGRLTRMRVAAGAFWLESRGLPHCGQQVFSAMPLHPQQGMQAKRSEQR